MKTKIISLLLFLVIGISGTYGQENKRFNLEEFKKNRIEFLKKELKLTNDEAKTFFPLSDELMRKKYELNKSLMEKNRNLKNKTNITDAEYEEIVREMLEVRIKEAKLEKEYYEKFKIVLSPEKIYKYQMAELKHARNMLNNRERPERAINTRGERPSSSRR
ncbi:hypothetical protein [Viscerimonas tarda]